MRGVCVIMRQPLGNLFSWALGDFADQRRINCYLATFNYWESYQCSLGWCSKTILGYILTALSLSWSFAGSFSSWGPLIWYSHIIWANSILDVAKFNSSCCKPSLTKISAEKFKINGNLDSIAMFELFLWIIQCLSCSSESKFLRI